MNSVTVPTVMSASSTIYYRGETYTVLENYDAAIADYQAAIDRFSQYDLAYQSLGYAYYKTRKFDQALDALNQALEISPNSPTAHLYLALVYVAMNDFEEAKAETAQAMNSIDTLSEEEQLSIFTRILADLGTFAEKNPAKAKEVEALINLIPEPK
jgi:tetratricopeptide (TPR) repeat protein